MVSMVSLFLSVYFLFNLLDVLVRQHLRLILGVPLDLSHLDLVTANHDVRK